MRDLTKILTPLPLFLILLAGPGLSAENGDMGRGRPGDVLYVHRLPDPVNVRNGNFYLPVQDLYLPCYGFPLEVYRSYNSISSRNGAFGKGWTLNYDLQIVVDEASGMRVIEADGFINEFSPVELDEGDRSALITRIVRAKKEEDAKYVGKPDGKGAEFYETYRTKLATEEDFFKHQRDRYAPNPTKASKSGKYVSRKRGTTHIEKKSTGYVRTSETGRIEEYDLNGLLKRITDRNDNELRLAYDAKSRLARVEDGCKQSIQFQYTSRGKISEIRDSLERKLTYQYDNEDRMTASAALGGEKTAYGYDRENRMTSLVFSDNTRTDIAYDAKTGYVTKQTGPGQKITDYRYGREGGSRWAVVTDNEGTKNRYEYSDAENKIVFTDKAGKKSITTVTACCGKPLSIKDERGVGEEFRYDDEGNLVSKTDSKKQTTTFKYEKRFGLPSEIKMHDGASLRFVYDGRGNLTFLTGAAGDRVKLAYEKHGKIEKMANERDQIIVFSYNSTGKPVRIEKMQKETRIGSISIAYDTTGEINRVEYDPKNAETLQNIKDTLASFMRFLKPSGIDFEI
jgi:YD repeat-containing protein